MSTTITPQRPASERASGRAGAACAAILRYERVGRAAPDPFGQRVITTHFREHLRHLAASCHVMPLTELHEALEANALPERAVALTFDGGYVDVVRVVLPLLRSLSLPATVFVPSGFVGKDRALWMDDLDELLLGARRVPRMIRLTIEGDVLSWNMEKPARLTRRVQRQARDWRLDDQAPSGRHRLFRDLARRCSTLATADREDVLNQLSEVVGVPRRCRARNRVVSVEELRTLVRSGLVEIGAQTVTHAALAAVELDVQRQEIGLCRRQLEQWIDRPVTSFAAPGPVSTRTRAVVAHVGLERACMTELDGVARPGVPALDLPRFAVRDCDGEAFARQIAAAFDARAARVAA